MRRSPRGEVPPLTSLRDLYLYDEPDSYGLDVGSLGAYLAGVLPECTSHPRVDFFSHCLARFSEEQREALVEQLAPQLERAQLADVTPPAYRGRLPAEAPPESEWGPLYHGPSLQAILHVLLPPAEQRLSALHLVCTNLRLAVWPTPELPLRQVVALYGEPNLLSLSGLYEAPAAPPEYDFLRAQLAMLGMEENLEELEERFGPRMLGEGDPRLGEVVKGLMLQAVAYRLWGEAFCPDPACRLYDATSHEQLLATHTGPGAGLCARHRELMRAAGAAPERA